MVLNIVVLLLIAGITFMHSIFGLFSGIINLFCCVVAAVVALGSFEAVDRLLTGQFGLSPNYTTACALIGIFVVTLLILRALADNLIRGNVRLPQAVDWGGAAACGFVNAMICMGVMVMGIQLLPFGGRVMMYQRYTRTPDLEGEFVKFEQSGVWLNPDGFTAGLVNLLSGGSLSGSTSFASVYPDFTRWIAWTSNTVQPESLAAPIRETNRGRDGVKNGISVVSWWTEAGPVDARYASRLPTKQEPERTFKRFEKYAPTDGRLIGVRLNLSPFAADRDKHEPHHRFRPSMLRIVGADGIGRPVDYPCRLLRQKELNLGDSRQLVDIDENFAIPSSDVLPLDVYFEVGRDFTPHFVEYRRFARARLDEAVLAKAAPAKAPEKVASTGDTGQPAPEDTGLRESFVSAITQGGQLEDLPFGIGASQAQNRGEDLEISGDAVVRGRYSGPKQQLEPGPGQPMVGKLQVPENRRLVQIRFRPYRAKTLAGQVFNFVDRTLNQYKAVDDRGNKHDLSGYFAVIKRDGADYVELFYAGAEPAGWNGLLDFKQIEPGELTRDTDDVEIGLFFLVSPGTTIVRIENQVGKGVDTHRFPTQP